MRATADRRRALARRALTAGVLAVVAAGLQACGGGDGGGTAASPKPSIAARLSGGARPTAGPDYRIVSIAERDAVQAVDRPEHWSVDLADAVLEDDERVIGVAVGDRARAYSVPLLSVHQVANDTLAGTPIAVTWSPLCSTAVVYARPTVDGRELDFGVSGKVIMNCPVLYDRQSDTLWSQVLGTAVWGALEGRRLDVVPSQLTTWAAWKRLHPDTEALARPAGLVDPFAAYYAGPEAGVHGEAVRDDRLDAKALVTGLVVGNEPVAYPNDSLARTQPVHDTVGGVPVLLVADETSGTVLAYDRSVDGAAERFLLDAGLPVLGLRDASTLSRWDGWTGRATDGPLAARRLRPLASTPAFWFAWKDYHPSTRLHQADG